MIKKIFLGIVIITLTGCSSVEKYNQQISKLHTPNEIKDDVDFVYRKFQKLHPDLYWYISKDSLDIKIQNLKKNVQKPISSIEFYEKLAPVLKNIGQGHISMYTPHKKQTKEERKKKGKRSSPFKPLAFYRTGDKLFIKKNYGKDSTLVVGAEIMKVENEKVSDLLNSFEKHRSSDGYNTTFLSKFVGSRFSSFYTNIHPLKDSILITLKNSDSIYNRYLYANYAKEKSDVKKDSTKVVIKKLSKQERKLAKQKRKETLKTNSKYGYDKYKKEYTRSLNFIASDTVSSIAYMKIRGFTNGNYKDFYKESFGKIDSSNCKNLVIDLRGNTGGRLAEIDDLYSYLIDKKYVFIEKSKVTRRFSYLRPFFHHKNWFVKTSAVVLSPILIPYHLFKVKKEKGELYYKFKQSKLRDPKPLSYDGKIYVLIDGESFSASSILSTHLKATERATFLGEETGGAYNGTVAGQYAQVELPNSKIKINIGLLKINAPYTTSPDGYGIKPDIGLSTEYSEKDLIMDWVINDVKK